MMTLFDDIKIIITAARSQAFRAVNSLLLTTYWQIGKCVVEDEQAGKVRAKYGEATLKILAEKLTLEFGKGFDFTNLTNMRKFYIAFPKLDALRQELSWTHYRIISRQASEEKRLFYVQEAADCGWSGRQLERK